MTVSALRGGRSGLARLVSSPPYFFNTLVPLNPFFHKHQGDGSLWQLESGNEGSTAGWKKDSPHSRAERPVSKRWPSALRARRPWTSRSKPLSLSLPHPGNGARTSTPIVGRAKQVCKRSVRHAAGAPRPGSMSGHTADPPRAQGAAAHLGLLFPSAWKTAVGVHPTNTSGGLGTSRLLGRSKCKQFGDGIGMRPRPSTSAAGAMRPGLAASGHSQTNKRGPSVPGSRSAWARVARFSRWGQSERNTHRYCEGLRQNRGHGRARKCRGEELQKQSGKPGRRRRPPESLHGTRMQRRRVGSGPRGKLPQGLKPGWHKNQAARTVFRGLNHNPPPGSRGELR